MGLPCLLLAVLGLAGAEPEAGVEPRRGPLEVRDEFILAQPRLTLPAVSPDTLGEGGTSARLSLLWGNTFGWDDTFFIDGETRTVDLTVRRGILEDLDLGLRLPVRWRGAGVLDPLIDNFHDETKALGSKNNTRPAFAVNTFKVEGVTSFGATPLAFDDETFTWSDDEGLGLGDVELEAKWRLWNGGLDDWSAAVVARLGLPTATGPFCVGGVSGGLQAGVVKRIWRSVDVYLGGGGTGWSQDRIDGVQYEVFRGHGFAALEWRPVRRWSLLLQSDYATRLVRNVVDFAGHHFYAHLGSRIELSRCLQLELGITENLLDLQTTSDFAFHVGLVFTLAPPSGSGKGAALP